ncbi:MAG: hypothetical protein WBC71_11940, partial [Salaquimonas sp.]
SDSGMKATLILWQKWNMGQYARSGQITASRKRWNGGTHGLDEVKKAYARGVTRNLTVPEPFVAPIPTPRPEPIPEPITVPDIVIEDEKEIESALRDAGSRTIKETDVVERVGVWGSLVTAVKYAIDQVTDFLKDMPDWVFPALIICAAVFIWYRSKKIKAARVDDTISGKNISRIDHVKSALRI